MCVCVRACVVVEYQCACNVWQTVLFSVLYVALLCFYRTDDGANRIKTQVSVWSNHWCTYYTKHPQTDASPSPHFLSLPHPYPSCVFLSNLHDLVHVIPPSLPPPLPLPPPSLPPSSSSPPSFQCATLPLQALLALPGGAVCISGCSSKPGPQQHCSKFTHNHSIAQNRACYAHAYVCTYVANRSYWLCSLTCPTFQSVFVQYIRMYSTYIRMYFVIGRAWASPTQTTSMAPVINHQSITFIHIYVYVCICTVRFTVYVLLFVDKKIGCCPQEFRIFAVESIKWPKQNEDKSTTFPTTNVMRCEIWPPHHASHLSSS